MRFWLLLALLAAPPGQATSTHGPHGRPEACGACHTGPDGTWDRPDSAETMCRTCHPTADMHPVGIVPRTVSVPDAFPLEAGRMTCTTCHAEPSHDPAHAASPPWFRGGPYASVRDLCFSCHERAAYQRANPHGTDGGCTACHTTRPEAEAPLDQAHLRTAPEAVCTTCHAGDVHLGARSHLGRAVASTPPAGLPLVDAKIACITCHDVHTGSQPAPPTSALSRALTTRTRALEWSGLPADLTWPGQDHDALLALPLHDDALCTACHGDGP